MDVRNHPTSLGLLFLDVLWEEDSPAPAKPKRGKLSPDQHRRQFGRCPVGYLWDGEKCVPRDQAGKGRKKAAQAPADASDAPAADTPSSEKDKKSDEKKAPSSKGRKGSARKTEFGNSPNIPAKKRKAAAKKVRKHHAKNPETSAQLEAEIQEAVKKGHKPGATHRLVHHTKHFLSHAIVGGLLTRETAKMGAVQHALHWVDKTFGNVAHDIGHHMIGHLGTGILLGTAGYAISKIVPRVLHALGVGAATEEVDFLFEEQGALLDTYFDTVLDHLADYEVSDVDLRDTLVSLGIPEDKARRMAGVLAAPVREALQAGICAMAEGESDTDEDESSSVPPPSPSETIEDVRSLLREVV